MVSYERQCPRNPLFAAAVSRRRGVEPATDVLGARI
jgi:hypothetical protein